MGYLQSTAKVGASSDSTTGFPGELGGSVHDTNDTGDGGGDGNISMIFSSSSDMLMGDDGLLAKYGEVGREFVLRR